VSFQVEIVLNSEIKLKDLISFKTRNASRMKKERYSHQTRDMMDAKIYHSDTKNYETYKITSKSN